MQCMYVIMNIFPTPFTNKTGIGMEKKREISYSTIFFVLFFIMIGFSFCGKGLYLDFELCVSVCSTIYGKAQEKKNV